MKMRREAKAFGQSQDRPQKLSPFLSFLSLLTLYPLPCLLLLLAPSCIFSHLFHLLSIHSLYLAFLFLSSLFTSLREVIQASRGVN